MATNLYNFTDVLGDADEIPDSQISQPISLSSFIESQSPSKGNVYETSKSVRPAKGTGQYKELRSVEEIDPKYRDVFTYPFFNLVQSRVIEDALYSDKSLVVCAPTGSGKTVVFEMAIVQLLMEMEDRNTNEDFKIIYMAPVKALCTERLTEWYSKFTRLGLLCIEVTGDTDVDFSQLQAYKIIITTPEKWDMLTRRWTDHRGLVEMIKLFLIDEVHILNDETRGPVLEAVVSRMKTIQALAQSAHRIEKLKRQYQKMQDNSVIDVLESVEESPPRIRFVAVSATVSNPEDVAAWLGTDDKPAVYHKFGDECRPVKVRRVVEGYPCADVTSIFKFDIILNYKLWPIIQKYHNGKPTLIFCNTRKSVQLTAETLSREITISFNPDQQAKLTALAATIKNKKLQSLVLGGVGCHHAGLLYEERTYIEQAFRNGDLPILITTTTLAMGVNLPAHLVIIKNTQQYVNGAYQEYSISTVLQMVGRAGRPQFDTEATAVIMTRQRDKARYQALAGGCEPLQSYLHKRLSENLNSEAALGTVGDVAQCVEWLRSTFLHVRAAKDPKRYLGLIGAAPEHLILKKIEELCVIAMNGLSSAGLITMDEASCIASTEAGRLMSLYYLDVETMKHIMKIQGNESLERLVWIICESHELADMHLRMDERRCLNALNRNNSTQTIRFPMKGKITTRQMKLNCLIQAILGCLPIPDPSINQEAMKVIRIADRICKCLVAYVTRPEPICNQVQCYSAVLNSIILAKCVAAQLWENSPFVSKQLKGIGPTFSTLLATAGKLNFMLLEESHPRDLERIMNKGPPAGNILRKQISLLPKYQLTATPIDENMVSIKLMLLNHAYLAENSENLTAGAGHKCYVVAGDSENHILMLRTFTDQDLISVYDGSMVYEIARKHNFEHKIFIHCISSKFAGVDVRCEYTFTSINSTISQVVNPSPYHGRIEDNNNKIDVTTMPADITKEKKRKNNNEGITQSKEKKKRDNTFTEKINLLKESFGRESNNLKKDLQNAQQFTRNTIYKFIPPHKHSIGDDTNLNKSNIDSSNFQDDSLDDFMDDAKIDSILNEIETEIIKTNVTTIEPLQVEKKKTVTSNKVNSNLSFTVKNCPGKHKANEKISFYSNKINKPVKSTNNYKFLELLEKNMDLSNESEGETSQIDGGFTEAIKSHVGKFLSHSNDKKTSTIDLVMKDIIVERNQESTEQSSGIYENLKNTDDGNFIAATQYLDLPEICVKDKDSHTYENKDKENYDDANINDINDIKTITKKIEDELYNAGQENELRHRDVNGLVKPGTCDSTVNISFQTNDNNKLQSIDTINEQNTYLQILGNTNKKKFSQNFNSYKTNEEAPLINLQKNNALTLPKMETLLANKENSLPLLDPALQSTSRKQDTVFSTSNLELQPPPGNQIFASINMELPLVPSNNRTGHLSHDRKSPYSQGAVQYLENNESMCCRTVVSSPIVSSKDALKLPPVTLTLPWNTLNESSMSVLPQDENSAIANIQLYAENYNQVSSEEKNISTTVPEVIYANDESSKENGIIISTNSNFDVSPTNVRHNKNAEFTGRSNKCNEDFDYSFSAEKVDIHTHFNENHKIRIIRRLKIDLDVKKIVKTKEDSNNMDHTQGSNAAKLVNGNEIICDSIQLKHKSNDSTENELKTSAIKVFKIIPDEIPEHHEPFKLNETTKMSNECIIDENNKRSDNETTSPCKDNKISNILQKYSKIIGIFQLLLTYIHKIKPFSPEGLAETEEYCDSSINISTLLNTEIAHMAEGEPIAVETCKSVDVIFPREDMGWFDSFYVPETTRLCLFVRWLFPFLSVDLSELTQPHTKHFSSTIDFRKKQKTSFKVPARQTPKSCNMSTTATSFKPNRPFKITDLQHLNVTLPTFTEDNKSSSSVVNKASSALLEQTNVMNINVIKRDFLAKRSDSCINETQHEDERHFHDNNQINPAVSPPPLLDNTLEISEDDFKIDHSMFNPKTMLKNFRREEEIIPPPPEFGNISTGYSYSPETIGYRNNNLTSQFYNYDEGTEGLDVEELQRKSLFEDNSQYDVDLTPSKETETWILDSNNEYENINSQITSLDTCSIMDSTQDSQNNQGRYSNSINTRRGRLTAFKFHRKSKLKM